jgi:hypothetical protein
MQRQERRDAEAGCGAWFDYGSVRQAAHWTDEKTKVMEGVVSMDGPLMEEADKGDRST